jgi:hypothetical protein
MKEPFQIFENHIFQEYTYKKITPCDICSQILRGKISILMLSVLLSTWSKQGVVSVCGSTA